MESNGKHSCLSASARGAVWASLALAAGLASAPGAALADEAPAAPAAEGQQQAAAATSTGQPQAAAGADTDEKATAGDQSQQQADGQATAAAQQQAPAASSDRGMYEQAGLHALTVAYVDEKGDQIAPAHREALADGESYAVASPAVGGYELADASQATVSGTVARGSGDVSVTVRYRSTLVTYTVVHERQVGPRSSEYRVSETETLTAPSGTRVTAAPREYDNYTCATDAEGRTAEVTPDGKATIVIKYDVIVPTYGVYFSTNGSYVPPQTGRVGDAITRPADPTRAGYSFAGWDTDGDGKADQLPATIPGQDVTATALWAPAQATYLVKYWGEVEGDDSSTYKYHLLQTETRTGTTDHAVPTAKKLDTSRGATYQWYQYAREDQGLTVSGDGTTVLNVYYDWKPVKVYYKIQTDDGADYRTCPDLVAQVTVKMYERKSLPDGQSALAKYRELGGSRQSFDCWVELPARFKVSDSDYADPAGVAWTDGTLEMYEVAQFTNEKMYTSYTANIFQHTDGGSYTTPKFSGDTSSGTSTRLIVAYERRGFRLVAWRVSTDVWDGKDAASIQWGEWHAVSAKDASVTGIVTTESHSNDRENVWEFKYDRIPYDVTYYSQGEVVGSKEQLYGSTIDVSAAAAPEAKAPEGMVFAGWYTNADFSGDPVTSLTMPEGGTHLYARWKRPDVTVTFDAAGGSAVAPETVAWGQKATRPADPVREGYQFGGWYYQGAGSSTPAPFPFDLALQADARLVAAWRSTNTPTTYTVRHVLSDGTVLWEEELPGTVGQTVSALALPKGDPRRLGHAYASASGATIDLSSDASQNVITFAYSDDASHAYVVHLWDEATGLPVAADVEFGSVEALLDYLAPEVPGYHVLFGGRGYLSARDGGQELTFWYERDPEPAEPATPAEPARAPYEPRHMVAVPSTGDAASPAAPAAAGAIGLGLAALGALLRRRRED